MRVAIVGGPGIGKSTLVRQLGDLYHHGSYGEGEKGVWDPRVLQDIEAGRNPVGVTTYFARLYDANYRDAAAHDAPHKVIFFGSTRRWRGSSASGRTRSGIGSRASRQIKSAEPALLCVPEAAACRGFRLSALKRSGQERCMKSLCTMLVRADQDGS